MASEINFLRYVLSECSARSDNNFSIGAARHSLASSSRLSGVREDRRWPGLHTHLPIAHCLRRHVRRPLEKPSEIYVSLDRFSHATRL